VINPDVGAELDTDSVAISSEDFLGSQVADYDILLAFDVKANANKFYVPPNKC
jgi:hypothetical protein